MLVYDLDSVYSFLKARTAGLMRVEEARAIGWMGDGGLTAGAVFERYSGTTIWAHVAIDGNLPRAFLRAFLAYPFQVCGVQSVRGYVLASNTKLRNLARRLGAVEEAILKQAAPDGDVVVCTLWRKQNGTLA